MKYLPGKKVICYFVDCMMRNVTLCPLHIERVILFSRQFYSKLLTCFYNQRIKTICSLRAEGWATDRYSEHVKTGQKCSVLTIFCGKLASGVMGLLFYLIYTFAFAFGTNQAATNIDVRNSYISPFACWGITIDGRSRNIDCGITGSEVMVCIYGVILCAQFFALMSESYLELHVTCMEAYFDF